MLNSCIYEGHVHHRRITPVRHEFQYALYMTYLDLAELDDVFEGRWMWSTRRAAIARFRRDDHLGDPSVPLDQAVRDLVEAGCGERPAGPIRLLTHLRYFGYVANPVSFYFCFNAADDRVEAVVAEVNNTPWRERHCYVLRSDANSHDGSIRATHDKDFHVSPFMGMDQQYRWKLSPPGEQTTFAIANIEDGTALFDASMSLQRRPITTWNLARALLRFPFMTGRIVTGIYWQALRLWWKRAPFYSHPKNLKNQKAKV